MFQLKCILGLMCVLLDVLVLLVENSVDRQNKIHQMHGHKQCMVLFRCLTKKLTLNRECTRSTGTEITNNLLLSFFWTQEKLYFHQISDIIYDIMRVYWIYMQQACSSWKHWKFCSRSKNLFIRFKYYQGRQFLNFTK